MAAHAVLHDTSADDPYVFAHEIVDIALAASRAHPHAARLTMAGTGDPIIADAIHFFTLLHAERPSTASLALARGETPWLARFAADFDLERAWLTRATVVAGLPRRIDLTRHEQLVRGQREAMLTLARSERAGCSLGAVVALAADWPAVRRALSQGAVVREFDPTVVDELAAAASTPIARRAIGFGVAQMLAVHRSLWDLLEARQATSLP